MTTFLPPEMIEDVAAARHARAAARSRLRVRVGTASFPVLRETARGFALALSDAPRLRGHVDLYDGAVHRTSCLIVASEAEGGEMYYEYKRATPIADTPAIDYERAPDAPVALLMH
ncbi:hypothetical protein BCF33_2269 [Hasllibacter halocynthiae]|uniref:Uncharacterized protein n=1 Tax=Hasllibacter halocynthiae TaxID=595589 RepID=A0A2T0X391_9RHOB|nr:hypothetical protein [Hasllibacter halocynthiae]PRY93401.1 hypothetical protein BCF33_2269 [Hasllibacter halocynthiae]